jgi:hypothetical protein
MKTKHWLLTVALSCQTALAADKPAVSPADDVSPLEKHPECMERTPAAAGSNCVIQDQGAPRHLYPPTTQQKIKNPPAKQVIQPTPKPGTTADKAKQ